MNTRQALQASLADTPVTMASLAKRAVIDDLHRQLAERIGMLRSELEAEDWTRAAIQGDYVVSLLRALAANEDVGP